MIVELPFERWSDFLVRVRQITEAVCARGGRIDPVIQTCDACRPRNVAAARDRAERARLNVAAEMERRRGRVVDDIDRAAWRPAAEKRRTRSFQNLNALDAVQRMRHAVYLVPVRDPVVIDLRLQPTDHKVIVVALGVRTTGIHAAGVADTLPYRREAFLGQR